MIIVTITIIITLIMTLKKGNIHLRAANIMAPISYPGHRLRARHNSNESSHEPEGKKPDTQSASFCAHVEKCTLDMDLTTWYQDLHAITAQTAWELLQNAKCAMLKVCTRANADLPLSSVTQGLDSKSLKDAEQWPTPSTAQQVHSPVAHAVLALL